MEIQFYPGWPLRYAHVKVRGLSSEHASQGIICLWAEDDPAQVEARDIRKLWARLEEWAQAAQTGFSREDSALDGYVMFAEHSGYASELPLADLIRGASNGFRARLTGEMDGISLQITVDTGAVNVAAASDKPRLKGAFYLRRDIGAPPRNMEEFRGALTRKQTGDLERGLAARSPQALNEPSGGYDFAVLAWPRHDREHDAVVVGFANRGDELGATAYSTSANDSDALKRRAGPDTAALGSKRVLIAGVGSVGGNVAHTLAASGVGHLHLRDSDFLKSTNIVRHVAPAFWVGSTKTGAVSWGVTSRAPWCEVASGEDLPYDPVALAEQVTGFDLVIDCTGTFSMTAALAEVCRQQEVPLVTGALFHQGAIVRVQRQTTTDVALAARHDHPAYLVLPPEPPGNIAHGFLELGCTAPVNNTPPLAVQRAALEVAETAVDYLTGRSSWPDETVVLLRPLSAPFDRIGPMTAPTAHRPEGATADA